MDPLVEKGLGEEDFLTLVLPYIESAKAGVLRLGKLLEEYGTYESNGIAFADREEIWYMETIGGHHWLQSEFPTMPMQLRRTAGTSPISTLIQLIA